MCVVCAKQNSRVRTRDERGAVRAAARAWRARNPEAAKRHSAALYARDRARKLAANNAWRKRNRRACYILAATRRARKKNAAPQWADLPTIKAFYLACPPGFQVDHIVPIQGETVCGLHVQYNLQYLTPRANQAKGNRLDVMPEPT